MSCLDHLWGIVMCEAPAAWKNDEGIPDGSAEDSGAPVLMPAYLAIADLAASICALTASRLKLAPFCIGGNSTAVMASFSTCCWTNTKRQNSYLNQSKYCCPPSFVPLFG